MKTIPKRKFDIGDIVYKKINGEKGIIDQIFYNMYTQEYFYGLVYDSRNIPEIDLITKEEYIVSLQKEE